MDMFTCEIKHLAAWLEMWIYYKLLNLNNKCIELVLLLSENPLMDILSTFDDPERDDTERGISLNVPCLIGLTNLQKKNTINFEECKY